MIEAGKVSLLVHTANRPGFLLRLLDYYDSVAEVRSIDVVVLDASGDESVAAFESDRGKRDYSFPLRIVRHDPSALLYKRFAAGLEMIESPYVMLAADDDLFFFDWLETAIGLLDTDPSFGTVYGHTLKFETDGFVPHGDTVRFFIEPVGNPPDRWLEGETPADRLLELGSSPSALATTGWYALQRASQLRAITGLALRHGFSSSPFFERFLIFAQAALHKTRRLDQVYIARQIAPGRGWPPLSFRDSAGHIERLEAACAELLAGLGFDDRQAEELIAHAYRGEFAQMKRADAKRHMRRLADALPLVRTIWEWLVPPGGSPYARDERLPMPPALDRCQREMAIVRRVVSGEASVPDRGAGLSS